MSQIPLAGTVPDDLLFFRFFSGNIRKDFWNCSYDLSHNISSFLDTNDELLFKALASLMDIGEAENKELIL